MEFPWNIAEIKKRIPHRYPFLLVDGVIQAKAGESIVAFKQISMGEPVFQGHFPEFPIFPGVMIIEGLAQTAGLLMSVHRQAPPKEVFLTEVIDARFKHKVLPGDTLRYEVKLEKQRGPFCWFDGNAFVGNDLAAKVKICAYIK